ncbi:hypothetical protein LR48_Vigan304s000900 [Vigna angularis]|uniref:Uncharacterized protein n=1 Tax=Phaseolus angularis TaxID=3914 RepID=A0A0L9T7U6_PHAAN|nr:hypothetical protein LR48_Vigan304s000900 [Vigna angularis]
MRSREIEKAATSSKQVQQREGANPVEAPTGPEGGSGPASKSREEAHGKRDESFGGGGLWSFTQPLMPPPCWLRSTTRHVTLNRAISCVLHNQFHELREHEELAGGFHWRGDGVLLAA